jgi:hypothetical protein
MSKKRTKKEKMKAGERRGAQLGSDGLYTLSDTAVAKKHTFSASATASQTTVSSKDSIEKLFGYPLSAIYKDLGKTAVVTLIVTSLLAAITYYVRFLN